MREQEKDIVFRPRRLLQPLAPENPIIWIDEEADMIRAARQLGQEKKVGLDVETTLQDPPLLCTVQIATGRTNYVFDALALCDLSPVFRILEDDGIIKIIHYSRFEESVFGNLGVPIRNIFDTFRISRKLRGKRSRYQHSLARVCRRELGRPLDKRYQKSNWMRRPLSPGQLHYAALDAEVMLLLYDVFSAELKQRGLPL